MKIINFEIKTEEQNNEEVLELLKNPLNKAILILRDEEGSYHYYPFNGISHEHALWGMQWASHDIMHHSTEDN